MLYIDWVLRVYVFYFFIVMVLLYDLVKKKINDPEHVYIFLENNVIVRLIPHS